MDRERKKNIFSSMGLIFFSWVFVLLCPNRSHYMGIIVPVLLLLVLTKGPFIQCSKPFTYLCWMMRSQMLFRSFARSVVRSFAYMPISMWLVRHTHTAQHCWPLRHLHTQNQFVSCERHRTINNVTNEKVQKNSHTISIWMNLLANAKCNKCPNISI